MEATTLPEEAPAVPAMDLPVIPPFPPMEAEVVEALPSGEGWQYEPKWDGFRCLVFRDGATAYLQSKSMQPLARYFPEVISNALLLRPGKFVLDAELVIPEGDQLSFDDLLQRIHPAESRVRKLAREHPAWLVVFDLLVDGKGRSWTRRPLSERRPALEEFFGNYCENCEGFRLSPATGGIDQAGRWLAGSGSALDGVMAKQLDAEYRSGERDAMQKVKRYRSADCVVGGFRYHSRGAGIGSLLLGLYDEAGLLHHVGFCSGLSTKERRELEPQLKKLIRPPGFTGRSPGGPSRWSTERSAQWEPLEPKLVVEVSYDHVTGERFRHGTRLLRWRPDKAPTQCRMDQIRQAGKGLVKLLKGPVHHS